MVERQHFFLKALSENLASEKGFKVVGAVPDWGAAKGLVDSTRPDVVLLDIKPKGVSPVEILRELSASTCQPRVIAFAETVKPRDAVAMAEAGIWGILIKTTLDHEFGPAVRAVMADKAQFSGEVRDALLRAYVDRKGCIRRNPRALAPREQQVLDYTTRGWPMRRVAEHLGISVKTVESYRSRLAAKLGVQAGWVRGVEV